MANFKARKDIKQIVRHGEAGSAVINNAAQEQMAQIREAASTYPAEDVLNMDETSFFWKMQLSRSLHYQRTAGIKKDKTCITVALTCDATGHKRYVI